MQGSVYLNYESKEGRTNHVVKHEVLIGAVWLVGEFDRDELLRLRAHLTLGKVKLVQEVFDLWKNHMHRLAIFGVDHCSKFERVARFVLRNRDH